MVSNTSLLLQLLCIPIFNWFFCSFCFGEKDSRSRASRIGKLFNLSEIWQQRLPNRSNEKAGVDMTQAAYIEDAMKVFEQRLNELEKVVAELE